MKNEREMGEHPTSASAPSEREKWMWNGFNNSIVIFYRRVCIYVALLSPARCQKRDGNRANGEKTCVRSVTHWLPIIFSCSWLRTIFYAVVVAGWLLPLLLLIDKIYWLRFRKRVTPNVRPRWWPWPCHSPVNLFPTKIFQLNCDCIKCFLHLNGIALLALFLSFRISIAHDDSMLFLWWMTTTMCTHPPLAMNNNCMRRPSNTLCGADIVVFSIQWILYPQFTSRNTQTHTIDEDEDGDRDRDAISSVSAFLSWAKVCVLNIWYHQPPLLCC